MSNNLKFETFSNPEMYFKLKQTFLMKDVNFKEHGKIDLKKESIEKIEYAIKNIEYYDNTIGDINNYELETNTKLVKKTFDDYLFRKINSMSQFYIGQIELRRKRERLYTNEDIIGYYNSIEEDLIQIIDKLIRAQHLSSNIKSLLQNSALEIKDFISEQREEIVKDKRKIPFKLSRENLSILFGKLHQHGYLDNNITLPQLADILSRSTLHSLDKPITSTIRNNLTKYSKINSLSEKKRIEMKDIFLKIFS